MHTNITQGADEWDNAEARPIYSKTVPDSNSDTAGPRIKAKAIAKLDELAKTPDRKFAMLVHLFEPHSTYVEHPGHKYTEHGDAGLVEKYDFEIAFDDAIVGELLDALDKDGLASTTTVVVMADHGEAFGIHTDAQGARAYFHGDTLYHELLNVPLMFRVPGSPGCTRDDVVQLIDLAPTIAHLFGVTPPASWQGRSLVPALACKPGDAGHSPMKATPAFSELLKVKEFPYEAKSMVTADGKHHVIFTISNNKWELFDLEKDPDEKTNVIKTDPEAKQLQEQLTSFIDKLSAAGAGP
jgi:arylsulfatase A-like enzyme